MCDFSQRVTELAPILSILRFTVFKKTEWGASVPDKIVLSAWSAIAGGAESVFWIDILDGFLEWYQAQFREAGNGIFSF